MTKIVSSVLAIGSMSFMFWFDVAPKGEEYCNSSIEFATVLGTDSQKEAARAAKTEFCKTVASYAR